ncbi:hypothetical protein HU200_012116 [Digitaria exilis]|uniref:Uncharacterized protein n=1 Tax=Digitaria exilis TaxID=1010633 RepID=A0A835FG54_9POAL|nr:hypothetical protein HU200_012116 [Digitaria exilis]
MLADRRGGDRTVLCDAHAVAGSGARRPGEQLHAKHGRFRPRQEVLIRSRPSMIGPSLHHHETVSEPAPPRRPTRTVHSPHHIRMTPCVPVLRRTRPGPGLTINPATHTNERTPQTAPRHHHHDCEFDMEEFQEADVLWPDDAAVHHQCHRHHHLANQRQQPHAAVAHHHQHPSSPPVRIPTALLADQARPTRSNDDDDDDGMVVRSRRAASSSVGIVPPHVLAARQRCADERRGHGRTLKGRDLRAVRNAVLHMTGFLGSSDEY